MLGFHVGLYIVAGCTLAVGAEPAYMEFKPGNLNVYASQQAFLSLTKKTAFVYQTDGNFVCYQNGAHPWATNILSSVCASSPSYCYLTFQNDGNFVAYNINSSGLYAYWETGTAANFNPAGPGTRLVFRHEAPYITVFNAAKQSIWNSGNGIGTNGAPKASGPGLPSGTVPPTQTTITSSFQTGKAFGGQVDSGSYYADTNPYPNGSGSGSSPNNKKQFSSTALPSSTFTLSQTKASSTSSSSPTASSATTSGASNNLALGLGLGLGIGLGVPIIGLFIYCLIKRFKSNDYSQPPTSQYSHQDERRRRRVFGIFQKREQRSELEAPDHTQPTPSQYGYQAERNRRGPFSLRGEGVQNAELEAQGHMQPPLSQYGYQADRNRRRLFGFSLRGERRAQNTELDTQDHTQPPTSHNGSQAERSRHSFFSSTQEKLEQNAGLETHSQGQLNLGSRPPAYPSPHGTVTDGNSRMWSQQSPPEMP